MVVSWGCCKGIEYCRHPLYFYQKKKSEKKFLKVKIPMEKLRSHKAHLMVEYIFWCLLDFDLNTGIRVSNAHPVEYGGVQTLN